MKPIHIEGGYVVELCYSAPSPLEVQWTCRARDGRWVAGGSAPEARGMRARIRRVCNRAIAELESLERLERRPGI